MIESVGLDGLVELSIKIPVVSGGHRSDIAIDPCIQTDRHVLADVRVTRNLDPRITNHRNGIGEVDLRVFATRNVKDNHCAILIVSRIIVNRQRAFSEPRTAQERMFEAVSIPVVGKERRVDSVAINVNQFNLDINFTTVADEVRVVGDVQSVNV